MKPAWFVLLLSAPFWAQADELRVHVTAAEAAVTLPACNGIVHAQSFCDGIPCPGQAPHEWTLDADLHAIDMDASSAWHLSFRSESCWAADITTAPGVSSVEMQLWRRAVLHGTFTGR